MEENQEKREFRGLYKHVKISVKALDTVIVACILVVILVLALDLRNPGFTITFDSKGGTDVPGHNQTYGQLLELPEPPTREGYRFAGWFKDPVCDDPWVVDSDTVQSDFTLYARWEAE